MLRVVQNNSQTNLGLLQKNLLMSSSKQSRELIEIQQNLLTFFGLVQGSLKLFSNKFKFVFLHA